VIAVLLWLLLARGTPGPVTPPLSSAPPALPAAPALPAPQVPPPAAPVVAAKPAVEAAPPVRKPAVAVAMPKPVLAEPRPAASAPAVPVKTEPKAAAESRVYALNELPDDIRRQLPAIAVGGSMYSASKADRLLIINGQVLHEGDAIAPGLMLEQIRLKAAVLAFKGYRYAIAF
jgi:general secretion pathway protein B